MPLTVRKRASPPSQDEIKSASARRAGARWKSRATVVRLKEPARYEIVTGRKGKTEKHHLDAGPSMSANDAKEGLTQAEIRAAKKLVERALRVQVLPVYSSDERVALAIVAAHQSLLQAVRGKKSRGPAKKKAEYRRNHVNLLLRYVVERRYRESPKSLATVMKIVDWLDSIGIEASEPQVRRDIHKALQLGPLPTW